MRVADVKKLPRGSSLEMKCETPGWWKIVRYLGDTKWDGESRCHKALIQDPFGQRFYVSVRRLYRPDGV